jgi:transposase InsO family protein
LPDLEEPRGNVIIDGKTKEGTPYDDRWTLWMERQREEDDTKNIISNLSRYKEYELYKDMLVKIVAKETPYQKILIVVPAAYRREVIEGYHVGHPGVAKMNKLILGNYIWKGARREIKSYVASCRMCQSKSLARPYGSAGIQQHFESRKENVLGRWAIDHNVFSKTARGNKHILTVMLIDADIIRLIAVPDQTAETTAKALFEQVMPIFGIPETIIADQGPAFTSNLMKRFAELCGFKMIYTTTGNSRGNSLVERQHRVSNEMLRAMIGDECDNDWDEKLPMMEVVINGTSNPKGEFCGHEKLYGQRVRLPGDHMKPELLRHCEEEQDEGDYAKKIAYLQKLREQASAESLRKRIESVDYQIRGKKFKKFYTGDRVLWHHQHRTDTTPKLRLAYTGPYRIMRVIDRINLNVAEIKHEETGRMVTVNIRKLKLLQTKKEAQTCLIVGCNRAVEKGYSRRTGLPKRACCEDHWRLSIEGRQYEAELIPNQSATPEKQPKVMSLPGDWMLVKIRRKYYVGVALNYDDHRDEWTMQYLNTYGKSTSNSTYKRCWIDEKDGMEFFSNQPSRITSKYRPLITNVKYRQIRGAIREDKKGRIPLEWRNRLEGKTLVKKINTHHSNNNKNTHTPRRGYRKY